VNRRSLLTWSAVMTTVLLILLALWLSRPGATPAVVPEPTAAAAPQVPATTAAPQVPAATAAAPVATVVEPSATTTQPQTGTVSYPVSAEQAGTLALAGAPGTALSGTPSLVSFQGVVAYEVPLDTGMAYVDATNGQVLAAPGTTGGSSTTGGTGGEGEGEGDDDDDDDDDD
jgi:hypothetical protein